MKYTTGLVTLGVLFSINATASTNMLANQSNHIKNSCVVPPVQATSEIEFDYLNLSSNDTIIPTNLFDPSNVASYNFSSYITIYDVLGVSHPLSLYYIKTAAMNQWSVAVVIDGQTITIGQLNYASDGSFQNATGLDNVVWNPNNNSSPEVLNINLSCSTQYAWGGDNAGQGWQNGYSGNPLFHPALILNHVHLKSSCYSFRSTPKPTTEVKLNVNLNASNPVPPSSVIQPTDPASYNFKDTVTVYDSLGAPYNLSIYFAKDPRNGKWNVSAYMYQTYLGSGNVQFDSHGMISDTSGLDHLKWVTYSGAASPQSFKLDMTCSTQYGFANENIETPWQNGLPGQQSLKKSTLT